MRNQRCALALLSGWALAVGTSSWAEAQDRYQVPYVTPHAGPEGRGCYWMRQRLYCARYCYIEIDGRRYCQERARWAYPQAPEYDLFAPDVRTMK